MTRRIGIFIVLAAVCPALAGAQSVTKLSLADAVKRGLQYNVDVIVQEQQKNAATSRRLEALSALVPHVSGNVRESSQIINTAAFGFSGFGGLPNLIGPFSVFDARLAVSAPILDAAARADLKASRALETAAGADYREVRETIALAVGNLYLQTLADTARLRSIQAQVATAEALSRLATDQNASGLVARIDVVRQQVQLQAVRAQAIVAENQLSKRKLQLAHTIGLPASETIELTDAPAYTPAPDLSIDAAVDIALANRNDLRSAQARVDAAKASRQSAAAGNLPSLRFDGDIGALGLTPSSAEKTYTVAASLHVPIFEGGRTRARTSQADAELRQREAELADLTSGVQFDVRAALLDIKAAAAAVDVAQSGNSLAQEELTQAEDRFRAGVASTVELVQAQDAVARASDQYIASVYAHNVAKAELARALGDAETRYLSFIGAR
jgi:outer membrane protein TolC